MAHDDEAGLVTRYAGSDLIGALQQQAGHIRMHADRVAIIDG